MLLEADLKDPDQTLVIHELRSHIEQYCIDVQGQRFNLDALKSDALLEHQETLQEELRLSEERYRLVIQGSNEGIWDWDIRKDETFWNDRLYEMLGLSRETSSNSFWELIHPDDLPRVFDQFIAHLNREQVYEVEFRIRNACGDYIHCLSRGKAQRNEEGRPIRMAGIVIDITRQKRIEEQLTLAKEMAELTNQKKSQFIANMSHEFRTPLNAIIGFAEMLELGMASDNPEKQKRYAHYISVSGHHLLNLVNDILDISKIEAGRLELCFKKVELVPLLEEIKTFFIELAARKQVSLQVEVEPELFSLEADPARLRQILINLISNAIKFNHPQGKVKVQFARSLDSKWMICMVQDTGIGIPRDKQSQLFTEFFQVDTSYARQHEGTGLGLALTKRLIELHGGNISVESIDGVGSTFTFKVPLERGFL